MTRSAAVAVYLPLSLSFLLCNLASAVCPGGWVPPGGPDCYTVITQATPYTSVYEARQACLNIDSDIASFPDAASEELVYALVNTSSPDVPEYLYIGANDIESEGNFTWFDNASNSYTNFTGSEPSDVISSENCVAIHSPDRQWSSTSWYDVNCCFNNIKNINAVACKKPDNANITLAQINDTLHGYCFGDCPAGWHKLGSRCYEAFTHPSALNSTYDARQICQNEGADLPSLVTARVQAHVANIIAKQGSQPEAVYIGLNDIENNTDFRELDGSIPAYNNWNVSAGPSNVAPMSNETNCVALASDDSSWHTLGALKWRDILCCTTEGISVILCEKPIGSDVTVATDNDTFAQECWGDINECESNPCQNDATCQDHVLGYECLCIPGYTGANCETDIDECDSVPCQNNQPCTDQLDGYSCACTTGLSGTNCESIDDLCWSYPCLNNATCNGDATDYNCTCLDGFMGNNCETNIDECANVTCLNNGTCVDLIADFRCDCLPSFAGPFCGTEITCPMPSTPANATIANQTDLILDGWVEFQCFQHHKFPSMVRAIRVTCQFDGSWLPAVPLPDCDLHCDLFPDVAYSDISAESTTLAGTMTNYTCQKGFQFSDNSTVLNVTCDNGNWSVNPENISQCEIVKCPPLPDWDHQEVDSWNRTYNTTITFWCDVGYVLHDNTTARTIKCLSTGEWTADLPPCLPIKCPYIDIPDSWEITRNTTVNTYDTYALYECRDKMNGNIPYRMLDGGDYTIIKCDATGEWSDNVTDCTGNRCFPLPFVANATPSTLDAEFGTTSVLTCIDGHMFNPGPSQVRQKSMTCYNNGWWAPILSSCEPIFCDEPQNVTNALADTDNRLYGTKITYTCNPGYYYYPSAMTPTDRPKPNETEDFITCQKTEQWTTLAINSGYNCWPITCDLPPEINNGSMTVVSRWNNAQGWTEYDPNPDVYYHATNLNYTCQAELDEDGRGFKFIDGRRTKLVNCKADGLWNDVDASCRVDRCGPVPSPEYTVPSTRNTSWYTNVTYACQRGYEWPNNKSLHFVMCQNDGNWNQTKQEIRYCDIKNCTAVPPMANATLNDTANVHFDTFVNYTCDIGFKYHVDNSTAQVRFCSDRALWEPLDFPDCEIIHCPELDEVENATRLSNETFYNHNVVYECLPGYQYPDKTKDKYVTCQADETWTEYPPPCEVVFCPPLPYWTETNFNSTENEFLSVVSYHCNVNYSFVDYKDAPADATVLTSQCMENKRWSPVIEDCLSLNDINADFKDTRWESPDSVSIGTIACSLICVLMVAIILLDLNKLWTDLKMARGNCQSMMNRRSKISDSSQNLKTA